eukprot:4754555-Pleurochrysis_carterae.AAC.1
MQNLEHSASSSSFQLAVCRARWSTPTMEIRLNETNSLKIEIQQALLIRTARKTGESREELAACDVRTITKHSAVARKAELSRLFVRQVQVTDAALCPPV